MIQFESRHAEFFQCFSPLIGRSAKNALKLSPLPKKHAARVNLELWRHAVGAAGASCYSNHNLKDIAREQ